MFKYLPPELRPKKAEDWQDFVNMVNNQGYLSLIPGMSGQDLGAPYRTLAPCGFISGPGSTGCCAPCTAPRSSTAFCIAAGA